MLPHASFGGMRLCNTRIDCPLESNDAMPVLYAKEGLTRCLIRTCVGRVYSQRETHSGDPGYRRLDLLGYLFEPKIEAWE